MSRYQVSRRADKDLDIIWKFISKNGGPRIVDRVESKFHEAMQLLADRPWIGHTRPDVRNSKYRF
jgi:plasmid stabilization system protein ParE